MKCFGHLYHNSILAKQRLITIWLPSTVMRLSRLLVRTSRLALDFPVGTTLWCSGLLRWRCTRSGCRSCCRTCGTRSGDIWFRKTGGSEDGRRLLAHEVNSIRWRRIDLKVEMKLFIIFSLKFLFCTPHNCGALGSINKKLCIAKCWQLSYCK